MKDRLGHQTMLELYGCETELLNNIEFIEKIMIEAAQEAQATMVQQYFHQFSPHGVSGTIVIVESHINIHTWPEHDFAAIDIFSCSEDMDVAKACDFLEKALQAKKKIISSHDRGSTATIKKLREKQIPHHRQ